MDRSCITEVSQMLKHREKHSASEVTTLWRYTDLFIIIIIIIKADMSQRNLRHGVCSGKVNSSTVCIEQRGL